MLIGADLWSGAAFCFDPWVLYEHGYITNPNALLAGVIGRGKSTLAKSLAVRSIAFGRRVYVPGDPKGEWTSVSKTVGGAAIELGAGNRLNPLDPGPLRRDLEGRSPEQVIRQRRLDLLGSLVGQALGRPMIAVEHTAVSAALDAAVAEADQRQQVPTLPIVVDALLNPPAAGFGSTIDQLRQDGRHVGHALGRLVYGDLSGLFDGPSTVAFEPTLAMVSLDLSRISGSDTMIALVMTCASAWMDATITDPDGSQRWVIYDEAWRLIANPALLARMQSQWKLSRALGIANLMVIHRLSDLDAVGDAGSGAPNLALGLLGDCSTKIIYAQERGEAEKTGAQIGLTSTEIQELPDLKPRRGALAHRRTCVRPETFVYGWRAGTVRHERSHDNMTVLTPAEAVRACLRAGWRVRRGKHWVAYPPNGSKPVVFPATPSDKRGVRNLRAALRRAGLHV